MKEEKFWYRRTKHYEGYSKKCKKYRKGMNQE